jgi:hypothetical protein
MGGSSVSSADLDDPTLANVRDGKVKTKTLRKDQLQELCATLLGHIDDLELNLEKAKAPHSVSTPDKTFKLRAELKELKDVVFVVESGTNTCGDKPVRLTQEYWDTGNRQVIPWDAVHRLAAEQNGTPSNGEDNVKRVVNAVIATSVEEGDHNTSSEAKSAKLAKLVKLAKSTALWCLLPYVLLSQDAKDKQRKVCPVNLRGEVCTANNCSSKHPKVCLEVDQGKGKIPKAMCPLWHMQVHFTAKSQGNEEGILSNGRELALLNLLNDNDLNVGIVTKTEIPSSGHGDYNVEGYHSYLPLSPSELLKTAKYRVVVLVRSALATVTKIRSDLMHAAVQSVWIQLDMQGTLRRPGTRGPPGTRVLICGMYREWSNLARESTALFKVREQLQAAAAEVDNIVVAGNINLDTARRSNVRYGRRCLMLWPTPT